jgi:hypothetical protein
MIVVVIELAHRQSPWTLDWVQGRDRAGPGFIPENCGAARRIDPSVMTNA